MSRFSRLALDTEKPRRMTIIHPATRGPMTDGEGNEAFLDLLSLTSPAAQKARAEVQQRRIDNRARRVTVEEAEREALTVLAACVRGWYLVEFDGTPMDVPYSADAAIELLTDPGMRWLADQATLYADAAGNFLPGSSKT